LPDGGRNHEVTSNIPAISKKIPMMGRRMDYFQSQLDLQFFEVGKS